MFLLSGIIFLKHLKISIFTFKSTMREIPKGNTLFSLVQETLSVRGQVERRKGWVFRMPGPGIFGGRRQMWDAHGVDGGVEMVVVMLSKCFVMCSDPGKSSFRLLWSEIIKYEELWIESLVPVLYRTGGHKPNDSKELSKITEQWMSRNDVITTCVPDFHSQELYP